MTLNLAAAQERAQLAMAESGLPGLAMAAIHRNEQVFAGGWGHWDAAAKCPVDANTVFGLASLTKLVTTLVILHLESTGRLSLNDPIDKYFPVLRNKSRQPILLRHLLSHTAGFPGLPFRFFAADINSGPTLAAGSPGGITSGLAPGAGPNVPAIPPLVTADELATAMAGYPMDWLGNPGQQLNYSNEGFCLLGGVAEQVTGQRYAHLAQDVVFDPLGMRRSSIGSPHPAATDENNVALPLLKSAEGIWNGSFWQAPLFYAAGGAIATATDVARLVHVLSDSSPLLSRDQRVALMTAAITVPSRPQPAFGYGLGIETWRIDNKTTLCWHTGQRAGIASFMAWLPEEELAISVLSNVSDAPLGRIGHSILGAMLGRLDIAWPAARASGKQAGNDATGIRLERYFGEYGSAEGNYACVDQQDGKMIMRRRRDGPWLALHFADDTSGVVGEETFRFLDSGSVALDLRTLPRVDTGTA